MDNINIKLGYTGNKDEGMYMRGDDERGGAKDTLVANQNQSENQNELSENTEKQNQNQNPKNKVFYLPNKILYKNTTLIESMNDILQFIF